MGQILPTIYKTGEKFSSKIGLLHREIEALKAIIATLKRNGLHSETVLLKLQENEAELRALFDSAKDGIALIDRTGKVLKVNQRIVDVGGYSKDEIVGKRFKFLKVFPPRSRAQVISKFSALMQGNSVPPFRVEVRTKEGQKLHVELHGSLYKQAGKIKGMVGVMRDITARNRMEKALRESENRYRTIFENAGAATAIIKSDTTILFVNKEFEKISGYTTQELENRIKCIDFMLTMDRGKLLKYYSEHTENQTTAPQQYELHFKDRNGCIKNVLLKIAMIPGTTKSVASFLDITDQHHLERQLQQAQKIESIGRLAGGVAHDFNNLMTIIQGNAELLSMSEVNLSQSTQLEEIINAAQQAARLTKQLLLFSRKEEMVFRTIDLNFIIPELLKMLERLIAEDITIRTKLEDSLWNIEGDEGNLEQVIMNLVVNARDAMPRGGELVLKTENVMISRSKALRIPEAKAGKSVCLTLEDSGTGMDKEILDNIFDPFFTTKEAGKGTGLGLSVVYGIVKKHKGWVNVYTEKGEGTTFKLYFPACVDAS